jgi:hypothetical protein
MVTERPASARINELTAGSAQFRPPPPPFPFPFPFLIVMSFILATVTTVPHVTSHVNVSYSSVETHTGASS